MNLRSNSKSDKIISLSTGFILVFIFLEVIARVIPVSKAFFILPINCSKNKIIDKECLFRREANKKGIYSKGRIPPFHIEVLKSTNDLGQFTDIDFASFIKTSKKLKVISIGDSYVEAKQVLNQDTFHGILNNKNTKQNHQEIISTAIASAGNQFPTYVTNLKYVSNKTNLENSFVIFSIISNDFDESFPDFKNIKAGSFFDKNGDFIYFPYQSSFKYHLKKNLFANSHLLRYLFINIELKNLFYQFPLCIFLENKCLSSSDFRANIIENSDSIDLERIDIGYKATDIFIEKILQLRPSLEEKRRTIFVINSDNEDIYSNGKSKSIYFEIQRKYFIKKATSEGFSFINLNDFFKEDFKNKNKKFNFKNDGHWNKYAHRLIADLLLNKISEIVE